MNKIVPLPRKNNREKVYNMVIHVRKLPFGGDFLAINLCGLIFAVRDLSPEELNHEPDYLARRRHYRYLSWPRRRLSAPSVPPQKIYPPVILSSQNNGRMSLGYAVQRRMILYFTILITTLINLSKYLHYSFRISK